MIPRPEYLKHVRINKGTREAWQPDLRNAKVLAKVLRNAGIPSSALEEAICVELERDYPRFDVLRRLNGSLNVARAAEWRGVIEQARNGG